MISFPQNIISDKWKEKAEKAEELQNRVRNILWCSGQQKYWLDFICIQLPNYVGKLDEYIKKN